MSCTINLPLARVAALPEALRPTIAAAAAGGLAVASIDTLKRQGLTPNTISLLTPGHGH